MIIFPIVPVLLIVLILLTIPAWPYSKGWGYYPSGGIGTILVIFLIILLLSRGF